MMRYESSYRLHVEPAFGKKQLKGTKPSDIQSWLADLTQRFGPSTARNAFLVLQGALELAVADESIKKNPAKSKTVRRPKMTSEDVEARDDATVGRLIDAHLEMFQAIPVIGASCGLRQGELYGLALEDFDFDEQVLRVRRQVKKLGREFVFALPKNDRERTVPLPSWAEQMVRLHVAKFEPRPYTLPWERLTGKPRTVNVLFRWTDDKHIRARTYDELVWKPALAAAGVIPAPAKDRRGRRRYLTDRKAGLHALRH